MRKHLLLILGVFFALAAQAQIITTVAGTGTLGFTGDGGPATLATFNNPWGACVSATGVLYISDFNAHVVRKVSTAGVITRAAGNGTPGFTGTGGPASTAELNVPRGIAIDGNGILFIADQNNHVIRKVSAAGFITTFAGNGTPGFSGDGSAAVLAKLNFPQDVVVDKAGNVYISDYNHVIRKVNASGIISTIAGMPGTPGYTGDGGPATAAQLDYPYGMALDTFGNLYFADNWNNVVRKINALGIISTVAGNSTAGYTGDGSPATGAELNRPTSVAVDKYGNLFIADQVNNVIRKVNPSGIISTFAGNGTMGYTGDGGLAILAELNVPAGVATDTSGKLYIADNGNHVVRKINVNNHAPIFIAGAVDSTHVCENSPGVSVDAMLSVSDSDEGQTELWSLVSGPYHGTASVPYLSLSRCDTLTTAGLTYIPAPWYSGLDTFKVRVFDGWASDTITIYVRVNPTPHPGAITGSGSLCIGLTDPLSDLVTGGVWSLTNANATISGTGVVTGVAYGMDTVYYTVTAAGCTADTSRALSVFPVNDTITGPSGVCIGYSILLAAIPPGGTWGSTNSNAMVDTGLVTGLVFGFDTITYTVTNVCGTSTFQDQILINALVTPIVVITGSPGLAIDTGGISDTLTANLVGGVGALYTYQWQLNGLDIPGATNNTYISDTFHNDDSVTCFVSNGPCSTNTFGWAYVNVIPVGVALTGVDGMEMMVVPNPNKGVFSVESRVPPGINNATIEVTDIMGHVVYKDIAVVQNGLLKKSVVLDDGLASGMYVLSVLTTDGRGVTKFMLGK